VQLEIERKYLVRAAPPDLDTWPFEEVRQGYLAIESDGREVRVRQHGSKSVLTYKRGSGAQREEVEIQLDADQFAQLWPATQNRRVQKRRYRIGAEQIVLLDVFGGALSGLLLAEVEFQTAAECAAYLPPAWLGPDVTADSRYANRTLALHGRPPVEPATIEPAGS
jgi:CYTH domain-containing protein